MAQLLTHMDSAALVGLLKRSQLVPDEQLAECLTAIEKQHSGQLPSDPSQLAKLLIQQGVITRWHANHLLQSRWQGFFLGRYKILRPLGAGGMGAVYLAEHRVMGHQVAIKVLPKNKAATAGMMERFINEARTAAMLDHPNVVRAVDISSDDGQAFIVMEYVRGADVHKLVSSQGPLSISKAIRVCGQAAAGLQHAHERGVIHRDIKPSNLLISDDGIVKVLDMGLAHWKDDVTSEPLTVDGNGSVLGTVDYLSPEQALHSRDVDARSDLYSLGCTLFFMLAGRPPFQGSNLVQRLTMHQSAAPPNLCEVVPNCPQALDEVFQKLMAKNPDDRFQSGNELLIRLKEIKDGHTSNAPSSKPNRRGIAPNRPSSNPQDRETKLPRTDVTSAANSTLPSSDDLFASLPSSAPSSAGLPPAYLSSSVSHNVHPSFHSAAQSKQKAATAKSKSAAEDRTKLFVVIAFACFMALASLGATLYWLSDSKSKNRFPTMIQQREGNSEGTIIVISQD